MVNAKTTGFACSYNSCGKFVCLYNQKLKANDVLYEPGAAIAEACSNCAAPKLDPDCVGYLCQPLYTLATDTSPKPSCPAVPAADDMTYDLEQSALYMHNYYRYDTFQRLVATGWAPQDNNKTYAKPKSKMPALAVDCAIVADSKTKAACANTQYPASAGHSLNYHKKTYPTTRKETLEEGIATWFGELSDVAFDDKATYTEKIKKLAPNFADMIQKQATQFGCHVQECQKEGFTVAVCQYKAWEPQADSSLYTVGNTCTKCGSGKKCDPVGGLCITN
ncbi:SCP-like protein [Necator americanus]|uniref:SCP-like protein n=1 Tax=Necator americanus TaxID=51031 RepID=W2TWR8_NECAM|nr:SCP-like protein [Necator americanus]ETN85467.1 SCP-like protein [Necator americanus]